MKYLIVLLILISISCNKCTDKKKVTIRSKQKIITIAEVRKMVKEKSFFDKYWNKSGDFDNDFEELVIENKKVILDHASNLLWHQSGSEDFMNLDEAVKWIHELNKNKYAGKNIWRLPTLEEALTLMENEKLNDNLYIDPVFNSWQWCIITGDLLDTNKSWLIAFSGRVDWFESNIKINYVRPVCTIK